MDTTLTFHYHFNLYKYDLMKVMSESPLLSPTTTDAVYNRLDRGRLRVALPAAVIAAFLLFVFAAGIGHRLSGQPGPSSPSPETPPEAVTFQSADFPDFSRYTTVVKTLPSSVFPIHPDDNRRVIAVGDIHGMNQSLSALLTEISYDPHSDTLIHLGDIVSKSTQVSFDPTLSFMVTNHILGVRGNNDQKIIEWRAWMDWIQSLPGGRDWLQDMDSRWPRLNGDEHHPDFHAWLGKSHREWQAYVPDDWKLLGKHYKVARDMSRDHYDYLCSLPLLLYAPTAHTYFVHAGLLPADPTRKVSDPKQPLSHWPSSADPQEDELVLRGLQEIALLNQVPQNKDPLVLMNIRSLSENGKVTDSKKGTPWAELWNEVMNSCSGLPTVLSKRSWTQARLHCFPSTVIYGHAAARDLDVKRWSMGLDTGCTYGRRLTAIVLNKDILLPRTHSEATSPTLQASRIPFGDEGTAQIISVKCHV